MMRIGDELPAAQEGQYVTKRHAAAIIGVSKRTIDAYCQRGLLTVRYTCAGHARIKVSSLWRAPSEPPTEDPV